MDERREFNNMYFIMTRSLYVLWSGFPQYVQDVIDEDSAPNAEAPLCPHLSMGQC